jgi:diaminohydroxyphosphoribosylaminopyrimidine deaminase/5-amino-6-(5-phosphoribosylamino)uracil reductase
MGPEEAAIATGERETAGVWDWLLEQRKSVHQRALQPSFPSATQQAFLDLYWQFASLCDRGSMVVAHLGQSIDGFIATQDGDSYYVNGPQNLDHMHRMRALADVVVVGAGTIAADDPSLTTRRVKGPNPTRVILQGRRRLGDDHRVFTDAAAPTLLVRSGDAAGSPQHGNAEVISLSGADSHVDPSSLIDMLVRRGLRRIFVEGGGLVVSRFLAAGVLDRLQLGVAPVLIGQGRRGIAAPAQTRLLDCLRPAHRLYRMGDDLLFDYDLHAPSGESSSAAALVRLS